MSSTETDQNNGPVDVPMETTMNRRNEFLKGDGEIDMDSINARIHELMEAQRVLEERDPQQELATALMLDRADEIERIISRHPEAFPGWNELFSLALSGKPKLLKLAVQNGADINTPGKDGLPALVSTCRTKATTNPELYKLLLANGVDLYADDGYFTPLQKAISNEDVQLIGALADAGIDLGRHDAERGSCLFFALHMNSINAFYELVQRGASITCQHKGFYLLHYLALHSEISCGVELIEFLAGKGIDLESKDPRGLTPFLSAVSMGRLDLMQVLKNLGADMHALDSFGGNAFWVFINSAVGIHRPECLQFLSQAGLDINAKVGRFETPLSRLEKYVESIPDTDLYKRILSECHNLNLVPKNTSDPLDADL